jgi:secondary thiamine-phosphate synthase enzyme|tara:strand:+ start:286 stop:651 length:366 start_codon:yes stop_codon:yes gene_type:complete
LHLITGEVSALVRELGGEEGLCTVFLRHTSASLLINENADPDVQRDLEDFLDRIVPRGDPSYRHTAEGPDDMPSHIKMALTQVSISIPIVEGRLALGTWQGIYLWEHRDHPSSREILVTVV